MTEADRRFAERAIRRRPLFLALSWVGVGVAALLTAYTAYRKIEDPAFPIGVRVALVILILLNARQNLRQHWYAGLLATLTVTTGAVPTSSQDGALGVG